MRRTIFLIITITSIIFIFQACEDNCENPTTATINTIEITSRISFPISGDTLFHDSVYDFVISIPTNVSPKYISVLDNWNQVFGAITYETSMGLSVKIPTQVPYNYNRTQYLHPKLTLTNDSTISGDQTIIYYKL